MTDEDRPDLCVRFASPGEFPVPDADAVIRSEWVDERHDRRFRAARVAVVPGVDGVELLVRADADPERVDRLSRIVEFDVAMARRFGAATAGRPAPRTDDRLAELSAVLGDDAVRVAARGLIFPGSDGSSRPVFG